MEFWIALTDLAPDIGGILRVVGWTTAVVALATFILVRHYVWGFDDGAVAALCVAMAGLVTFLCVGMLATHRSEDAQSALITAHLAQEYNVTLLEVDILSGEPTTSADAYGLNADSELVYVTINWLPPGTEMPSTATSSDTFDPVTVTIAAPEAGDVWPAAPPRTP